MKPDPIASLSLYLDEHICGTVVDAGIKVWAFSPTQYVQYSIRNVEEYAKRSNRSLQTKALNPLSREYFPEIDISEELGPHKALYYTFLINIIN